MPSIDWHQLDEVFDTRYGMQTTIENKVAWALDPRTRHLPFTILHQREVVEFLVARSGPLLTADRSMQLDLELCQFRSNEGLFNAANFIPDYLDNPVLFWAKLKVPGRFLANIAKRLFHCLANSVPSERSFSAQNYIHCNIRNSLLQDKVDKLSFIYVNYRVLKKVAKSINLLTDDEMMGIENIAYARLN